MTASGWAERIVAGISAEIRRALALNPHAALRQHYQMTLHPTVAPPQRGSGGWCDGLSILEDSRIIYVSGPGRRENFTLLHELGHFLVNTPPAVLVNAGIKVGQQ